MNAAKSTLPALLLAGLVMIVGPSCDDGQEVNMVGGRAYPPVGSFVHVQFRRQHLGFASEKGISVMGDTAGVTVASSGELRRVTDEFVVLQVANEPNRELWIPRDVILLLDVMRPQDQE